MSASNRILLIGNRGQVGWELERTLAPLGAVLAVDYPEVDLAEPDSIRRMARGFGPGLIVNAAAYTAVDQAETETELAMAINGRAPGVLAEEAQRLDALLVHYSTDYVFDGHKRGAYVEDDPPNPLNAYGRSKLAGEGAVRTATAAHLIFRLCWVYAARGRNFLLTIRRLAGQRDTLRVVQDQVGSPTWARLVAEATALALQRVGCSPDRAHFAGTYHLSAAGATSWHGFAQAILELMPAELRRCERVIPISTLEYPTPARRPANSVLAGDKLDRVFGLRLPEWRGSLDQVVADLDQARTG
ncbi:MAG: dTDP-4-dehydrorhamnose reductase [Verrucomicrobia bacterium]|nr:dTDP-4-dehydrorhamnose reductase [Verrucomicrobiota bacterium]